VITRTSDPVDVWLEHGVPTGLLWRGTRYRVSDAPTPIYESVDAGMTHPIERRIGFRFQATDEAGQSHVVDVHRQRDGRYSLVAVYD
jgi:hypothetical protein